MCCMFPFQSYSFFFSTRTRTLHRPVIPLALHRLHTAHIIYHFPSDPPTATATLGKSCLLGYPPVLPFLLLLLLLLLIVILVALCCVDR